AAKFRLMKLDRSDLSAFIEPDGGRRQRRGAGRASESAPIAGQRLSGQIDGARRLGRSGHAKTFAGGSHETNWRIKVNVMYQCAAAIEDQDAIAERIGDRDRVVRTNVERLRPFGLLIELFIPDREAIAR